MTGTSNSGGARRGGGRPKGLRNKVNRGELRKAARGGILPLDYMLKVMRNSKMPVERRDDMAKAAAPYLHTRLQATAHTFKPLDPDQMTDEQLELAIRLRRSLALDGGNGDSAPPPTVRTSGSTLN